METKTRLALTRDFFQIMKQIPRLRLTQSSDEGIKRREYDLLVMLALNLNVDTCALTVTELSNLLRITPAGVTHLLNPLEELECITRRPDPHDRRVVLVGLTEKGQTIADGLLAEAQAKLSGLVEHLGEADTQTLIRLLTKMIEFLN